MLGYAARGISVVLTLLYLLTVAQACRAGERQVFTPVEGVPIAGENTVRELSILSSLADAGLALQQAAEAFAANRADAPRVTVETVADPGGYRTALTARLLSGEAAALFQLGGAADLAAFGPYLAPLDTLSWAEGAAVPPLRLDSHLVGIPFAVRGGGFIVNRAIFEAAGLPLSEITGYESWRDTFTALQEKIDAGALLESYPDLTAVTTLPAQSDGYIGRHMADLLLSGAFPSAEDALAAPALTLPDAADCEALLVTMIECSPCRAGWSGLADVTPRQMIENGLAAGRVAAVLSDTDVWRRVHALDPAADLSLLPVYFENGESGAVFADSPAYWAVNLAADEGARGLAGEFLAWLYREKAGAKLFAERFGAASPYRDTAADTGVALHSRLYACLDRGAARPALHSAAPEAWREGVLPRELREYLTRYEKTWAEVAAACEAGWAPARSGEPPPPGAAES